jgi:hypothetical protein
MKLLSMALLTIACARSGAGFAHHSFGMFDMTKCERITGNIKKFRFTYPHSWWWVEALGPDGTPDIWAFEGNDPASLSVRGWKPDTLKEGDKVTITFSPMRDGRKGGALRAVIGPNGKPLAIDAEPCTPSK